MPAIDAVLSFLSAALAVNSVPHLVHGLSGRPFRTPFVRLTGSDVSSARVNVVWGWANGVAAYLAVTAVQFQPVAFAVGALLTGIGLAAVFSKKD